METKTINGYKVKIERSECPEDPREWDNLGTMICFHSRYNLGDEHNYSSGEFFQELACNVDPTAEDRINYWDYEANVSYETAAEKIHNIIEKALDNVVILDLYLYDHGGISMSTGGFSCPWDSGQVGYIFVTKDQLRKEYNVKRITKKIMERAVNILEDEVKVYDMYLTGQVYGYTVEDPSGEFIDSCGGFFGYDHDESCMMEYVNSAIESDMEKIREIETMYESVTKII